MSNSTGHTPLFTQHSRSWEANRYVYPVISRRSSGLSIGVNLNTDRICNFDCIYCCVDRREGNLKPQAVDIPLLQRELDQMLQWAESGVIWTTPPFDQTPAPLRRLADIAFSGDGEPTASPAFAATCRLAVESRDRLAPGTSIVIITNSTLLDRPEVRDTLRFLDTRQGEIWAKLDAGNEQVYRSLIRSTIPFRAIVSNILAAGRERPIVIQSMFLDQNGQPPSEGDIADYVGILRELQRGGCHIRLVQVYTIARPVFEAGIAPASRHTLDQIAAQVQALGLQAKAFYGAAD